MPVQVEFPPLLPEGLHSMTLGQVLSMCVDRFPLSTTRPVLFAKLRLVLHRLVELSIVAEVWLDGGFLTECSDPKDIDFVLRVESDFYETCTDEQRAVMDWMDGDLKTEFLCDSYLLVEWPEGHEKYATGQNRRWFWLDLFGRGKPPRIRREPKGIAVVALSGELL